MPSPASALPLPVGTESGERGRERVGEGVPTTKLFLLLLRQLGKEKEKGIHLGKQSTGRAGRAWTRAGCLQAVPCSLSSSSLGWQRGDTAAVTASITDLCPWEDHDPREMLLEKGWQG